MERRQTEQISLDRERIVATHGRRATCSAGISTSSSGWNMKVSSVTAAPSSPTPTIHQMCQIRAKPVITAKNAVTKPVGLFFGSSIAGRHPDDHAGYAEEGVDACTGIHGEQMMQPNRVGEHTDHHGRTDHRAVTE